MSNISSVYVEPLDVSILSDLGLRERSGDNVHTALSAFGQKNLGAYGKSLPKIGGSCRWFGVRSAGRLFELQSAGDSAYRWSGGGRRSAVAGFTWASRRRLLRAIGAIQWSVVGDRWFLTLTYPNLFPVDVRIAKKHLQMFRKRLERAFGKFLVLVWKMEFQRRGAVHFHMLFPEVAGVALADFQEWASKAWAEVVQGWHIEAGGTEEDRSNHRFAGTNVQVAETDCARYFSYALSEKSYQDRVPANVTNCGRFWGIWGFRPEWRGALLTETEFIVLRRTFAAWERSKRADGRRRRRGPANRFSGAWYLTDNPQGALVLTRLVRVLERDVVRLVT